MYCPFCGKQIPDDSSFCPECGNDIRDSWEKQPYPPEIPRQPQKKTGAAKIILIVILAVLCLVLLLRAYTVERALRRAARQLREREQEGSSARLLLAAPNSSAEALLAAVNGLLELILKRLRPIAGKRNVELTFESIREVTADVDEVKLSLALNNLVENAIKYNVEGGWVRVTLDADRYWPQRATKVRQP